MLTKDTDGGSRFSSRAEYYASLEAEGRRQQARDAARTADAAFIETAKALSHAMAGHNVTLWKLQSPWHANRLVGRTEQERAECYEILDVRNDKNQDIATSLNNLEFGHPPKLGARLLPALEGLVAWCEEHNEMAGCSGLFSESTDELKTALEAAKQSDFFKNLPTQSRAWAR